MANRITCSYVDCSEQFDTIEAMRRHKAKDAVHVFYCKRCDEDCREDEDYFRHQLASDKHVCCPLCGQEFQSKGGRDRHVQTSHRKKQKLNCVLCQEPFNTASEYMKHFEEGFCTGIQSSHQTTASAETDTGTSVSAVAPSTDLLSGLELSLDQLTVNATPDIATDVADPPTTSHPYLENYFDTGQGVYVCPSPKCDKKYVTNEELGKHLLSGVHAVDRVQCPGCLKYFVKIYALVAHCESASQKCKIRETKEYDQLIANITKGILRVSETKADGSTGYRAAPVNEWSKW